jgi:hypothetical protein
LKGKVNEGETQELETGLVTSSWLSFCKEH